MKTRQLATASIVALLATLAGVAQAASVVAGWDFSQYQVDGIRTINGTTTTTSLGANYSSWDTTFNAGAGSSTYGTATLGSGIVPHHGSLDKNVRGPVLGTGDNGFDSHWILKTEGQVFTEYMSLTNTSGSSDTIVLMGDLTGTGESDTTWAVSFAGKSLGGDSEVGIEFSTDGSSYSSVDTVVLTEDTERFAVILADTGSATGYVRLTLDPTDGQPVIDNVAIAVPEPSGTLGLVAGLMALLGFGRLRA